MCENFWYQGMDAAQNSFMRTPLVVALSLHVSQLELYFFRCLPAIAQLVPTSSATIFETNIAMKLVPDLVLDVLYFLNYASRLRMLTVNRRMHALVDAHRKQLALPEVCGAYTQVRRPLGFCALFQRSIRETPPQSAVRCLAQRYSPKHH